MASTWSDVPLDPNDVQAVVQAQQNWNSGNQPLAIQLIRPLAEAEKPWATALLSWLLMQQGQPGIDESITWALRAARLGLPNQVVHTFNNAVGQLPAMPQLANRLPELLEHGAPWGPGIDPIGQGWNLIAQGQSDLGVRLMTLQAPFPYTEPQWKSFVEQSQGHLQRMAEIESAALQRQTDWESHVATSRDAITKAQDDLTTSAKQAGLLVTAVSSDATNSLYKADAARNARESRGAWIAGLIVLACAALVAVLPVAFHYLGLGPKYSGAEQIGFHVASTAALGAFSGVLLARARSRDRAAQRAHDLSTAMGTMISYSNQIADPAEKQRFMTTMGQVVLQAHLTTSTGGGSKDERTDLLAVANLIRTATAPTSSTPS